jgi:hypothetical protein
LIDEEFLSPYPSLKEDPIKNAEVDKIGEAEKIKKMPLI